MVQHIRYPHASTVYVALLALLAGSCARFSEGASGRDGGSEDPAPDADAQGPAGAILSDRFESGICAGWDPYVTDISRDVAGAHGGQTACKVCLKSAAQGEGPGISRWVDIAGGAGAELTVWIKADGSTTSTINMVSYPASGEYLKVATTGAATEPGTWRSTLLSDQLPAGTAKVQLALELNGPAGGCVVVDDVSLVRIP